MPFVKQKAPPGLGAAGRKLWALIVDDLAESGLILEAREISTLTDACNQQDAIVALAKIVAADGMVAIREDGSKVVHPALLELRQSRIVKLRLLGSLSLPSSAATPKETAAQRHGRHAIETRWARERMRRGEAS